MNFWFEFLFYLFTNIALFLLDERFTRIDNFMIDKCLHPIDEPGKSERLETFESFGTKVSTSLIELW